MVNIRNLLKRINILEFLKRFYNFPGVKGNLLFFLLTSPFIYLCIKDIQEDNKSMNDRRKEGKQRKQRKQVKPRKTK